MLTLEDLATSVAAQIGATPEEVRDAFGTAVESHRYPAGEWLFHESTPRRWMGVVAEGDLELVRGLYGDTRIVGHLGVGATVGEGLLLGDDLHTVGARTRRGVALWVVSATDLERIRRDHLGVFDRAIARVARRLGRRIAEVSEQLARQRATVPVLEGTRVEHDSLGPRDVPLDAYYGVQTLRALENFPISGVPLSHFGHLVDALMYVKKAAALANAELGELDPVHRDAIVGACDDVLDGALRDQFVVDMVQGGAGTSTNMNANEVVANRALERLGFAKGDYGRLHPNDHVNRSQSTNDVFPTAVKLAVHLAARDTSGALRDLRGALAAKAEEFAGILKMGRTELQDAVPMTLGQEFGAYALMCGEAADHLDAATDELLSVSLGATAIGTGLNCPAGYAELVTSRLAEVSGLPVHGAPDLVEATQDAGEFVTVSASIKRAAVQVSKICNDLRLLSSGPRAGFDEIRLPALQPGSSIMPGKVNPVVPEMVSQVCFQIVGYDLAVTMAAESGQLELNMAEPIIAYDLLHGLMLLKNAAVILTSRCVRGITANAEVCRAYVERSIGLVTALSPVIGYERSVAIAHEALETGRGVYELVREKCWLADEQLAELLAPENMTHPRART